MTRLGKMERWGRGLREKLKLHLHSGEVGRQFEAQSPGLDLDGPRKSVGMPLAELRASLKAYGRHCRVEAAPGEVQERELTETLIQANQTKSNQIKPAAIGACPEIGRAGGARGRRNAVRSNPVKPNPTKIQPNQTQSNLGQTEKDGRDKGDKGDKGERVNAQ